MAGYPSSSRYTTPFPYSRNLFDAKREGGSPERLFGNHFGSTTQTDVIRKTWPNSARPTVIPVGMPRPVLVTIFPLVSAAIVPASVLVIPAAVIVIWVRASPVIIATSPIIVPCRPSFIIIPPGRWRPGATIFDFAAARRRPRPLFPTIATIIPVTVLSLTVSVIPTIAIVTSVTVIATIITTWFTTVIVGTTTLLRRVSISKRERGNSTMTYLAVRINTNRLATKITAIEFLHGTFSILTGEVLKDTIKNIIVKA